MTDAKVIDIDVPATEEGWIKVAYPKRKLSEAEVGIDFPLIEIDTHAWKTLPGGKQVMIRTGGPGELSGNDMRKIDIAVKNASGHRINRDIIREELVSGYIPRNIPFEQEDSVLSGSFDWTMNPSRINATNMAIANNVAKGRKRHAGLSSDQLATAKKFEAGNKPFPREDMLKAVNVQIAFNQGMAKERFGSEPFTVYRGIYGKQAETILSKAKKGDTIRIDSNTLSSFTTNISIAKDFKSARAGKPGVVIKSKVSYRNVFDSYASNSKLSSGFKEDEVLVSPRGMKMTGVIIDD